MLIESLKIKMHFLSINIDNDNCCNDDEFAKMFVQELNTFRLDVGWTRMFQNRKNQQLETGFPLNSVLLVIS